MTDLTVRPVNAFDEDGAAIEVTRRIMRRASAEQDRYVNLERINREEASLGAAGSTQPYGAVIRQAEPASASQVRLA